MVRFCPDLFQNGVENVEMGVEVDVFQARQMLLVVLSAQLKRRQLFQDLLVTTIVISKRNISQSRNEQFG